MPNITLTKNLTVISSTSVALVTSAAVPVITVNTSNFTSQRRLSFWSSIALSSTCTATVIGTNESGATITESIIPSTVAGTPNITTQDFLSVTSVTVTSRPNGPLYVGQSSVGSTPWQIANSLADPFLIGFGLTYASSAATTSGSLDYTLDNPKNVFNPTLGPFIPSFSVSTAISTTGVSTAGKIDFPVTAWRFTINSTSSSGLVTLNAVPAGLGS